MKNSRIIVLLATVIILGFGVAFRITTAGKTHIPRNEEITIVATVKNETRTDGEKQIINIGDARLYVDVVPKYRVGDRLKISGKANDFGNIYNAQVEEIGSEDIFFSGFFANLKGRINDSINSYLPSREATLVSGTVLGIDSIEKSFRQQLVDTGTIHVVVVSGQNLMIVAAVFLSLFQYLGRRASLLLATGAVVFYSFLTGFEPPVLRASLMVILSTIAIYYGRQLIPIWSLFVSGLIIVLMWPGSIFEVSFQLTFAATFGIMTLGQYLTKKWERIPFLGQNAAIAVSAYIFTAPIILFYFGKISILSPLVNILVAEAIFPVMILGFTTAAFSLIFVPLGQLSAYLAYIPAAFFVKTVEIFAAFPVGVVELGRGNLLLILASYVFLGVFAIFFLRKRTS